MPFPILVGWSGGKDSAMTLYTLQQQGDVAIVALLTTLTEGYDRISMHGVRRELLEAQAEALGQRLHQVFIPQQCSNEDYAARMEAAMRAFQAEGVTTCAFGDLFLEDIRAYREDNLAKIDMQAVFPLWGRETTALARDFIDLGFKAIVTCVDSKQLDPAFAGRIIDAAFLADLPDGVDPCGENGEFHSFVVDGPNFARPVACQTGEIVDREGFIFCDLIPTSQGGAQNTYDHH